MMEQKEHKIQIVVLSLLDIAGIMISFLSANYIRNRRFWYENIDIELSTAILYMILLYLLLAFLKNSKQDFFKRGPWEELVEVTAKVTQYTALLIASMFCFKIASEISRIAFFLLFCDYPCFCIQKYLQRVFIACCQKKYQYKASGHLDNG